MQRDLEKNDLDNTKRIERPEDVLARRKKQREMRNRWYKRSWILEMDNWSKLIESSFLSPRAVFQRLSVKLEQIVSSMEEYNEYQ